MTRDQYYKYQREKKIKKGLIIGAAVTVVLVLFLTSLWLIKPWDIWAAPAESGVAVNNEIPLETGVKGTATNPFVILEVVPYEGYAEIGYLIDGCEPVDVDNVNLRKGEITTIGSMGGAVVKGPFEQIKFELENGDVASQWEYISSGTKTLPGYYEKVADGSGSFIQEVTSYEYKEVGTGKGSYKKADQYMKKEGWEAGDNYFASFAYDTAATGVQRYAVLSSEKVSNAWYYAYYDQDGNGNYVFNEQGSGTHNVIFTADDDGAYVLRKSEKATYVEQKKYANYGQKETYLKVDGGGYERAIKDAVYTKKTGGNFKWVTVEGLDLSAFKTDHNVNSVGEKVYTTRTDKYYRRYQYTYEHKNLFLKNVLHLTDEQIKDYHVVVKTIQPSELNKNLGWINRADLIYLNPKSHMTGLPDIWAKYNRNGKTAPKTYEKNFASEDLSWEAVMAIFKKVVVSEDYAGIIIDATAYDSVNSVYTNKSVVTWQFGKDKNGNETKYKNNASTGYLNNIYKLCVMLRSMNPTIFYNLYLNDYNGTVTPLISQTTVSGKTTGYYAKQTESNAATYWSAWTFLPTKVDGTQAQYADWTNMWETWQLNPNMAGNVSVVGHIYTYNGDNSLTFEFDKGTISYDSRYTKQLYDRMLEQGDNSSGSPSKATDYILNNTVGYVSKRSIRVLDIEPCNEFTLTAKGVGDMLLTYIGDITIVKQTSAAFIGKIEDLNKEYDLIYMGLNFGALNLNSAKTETVYNDEKLNGKIYLHVGDLIKSKNNSIEKVNWGIAGANATLKEGSTTYNLLRLSGNDITALKSADLTNFLEAGYPIIIEDNFLEGSSKSSNINRTYIDYTSNIANFVSDEKNRENVFTRSGTRSNNSTLVASISAAKPEIRLISQPVAYNIGVDASPAALKDGRYYINGTDPTNRRLSFKFQIIDEADREARYVAEIYIDANADGKFAEEEKQKQEIFTVGEATHTISKTLHESFFGIIPWKLQICKVGNTNIRTQITGYSAVMKSNAEKQTIRVLQVNQNTYAASSGIASNLNLQTDSVFQTYVANLNDFNVDFTAMTIADFSKLFDTTLNNAATSNPKVKDRITKRYSKSDASTDRLADFDMVILGFSDCYDNIPNTQGELDNLSSYITAGKSVLFSHDGTSFNNVANNFGYNFNIYFRDMLGMDRFGVRTSTALVKDDAVKDFTSSPYANAATTSSYNGTRQGYTYYAAMRLSDGITIKRAYSGIKANTWNNCRTTLVNKLNDGQLTMYPYNIKDTFTVAETHAQYYQLHLEDPDIVVWYTLATSSIDSDNMYGVSPYDAANNYYIYNKGNITYTGMGHSGITASGNVKVDEVKLFVNTIVAAYKAGLKAPAITVKDVIRTADNQYTKYSDLDPNTTSFSEDDVQRVEFSVTDFNFVSAAYDNDDLGVSITLEDGTPLKIYAVSDQAQVTDTVAQFDNPSKRLSCLKNETSYYVLYPMNKLVAGNSRQFRVYAENHIGLSATATVDFVQRTLFNLD